LAVADDQDMDNRGNDPITPAEVAKSKDEGLFDDEKGLAGTETVGLRSCELPDRSADRIRSRS
jgi:hypothetical protein